MRWPISLVPRVGRHCMASLPYRALGSWLGVLFAGYYAHLRCAFRWLLRSPSNGRTRPLVSRVAQGGYTAVWLSPTRPATARTTSPVWVDVLASATSTDSRFPLHPLPLRSPRLSFRRQLNGCSFRWLAPYYMLATKITLQRAQRLLVSRLAQGG